MTATLAGSADGWAVHLPHGREMHFLDREEAENAARFARRASLATLRRRYYVTEPGESPAYRAEVESDEEPQ